MLTVPCCHVLLGIVALFSFLYRYIQMHVGASNSAELELAAGAGATTGPLHSGLSSGLWSAGLESLHIGQGGSLCRGCMCKS